MANNAPPKILPRPRAKIGSVVWRAPMRTHGWRSFCCPSRTRASDSGEAKGVSRTPSVSDLAGDARCRYRALGCLPRDICDENVGHDGAQNAQCHFAEADLQCFKAIGCCEITVES